MNFLRKYWQDLGGLAAVAVLIALGLLWNGLPELTKILWFSFAAILVHQFEEYRWPGTFAGLFNGLIFQSSSPERYPLNTQSAMVINLLIAYVFYLLPILFPEVVWLALGPILMGFFQLVWHGIFANMKARTLYNPGLFAVIVLHIPAGVWYIRYITVQDMASGMDWLWASVYFVIGTYLLIIQGNAWMKNKNSPYSFARRQLGRYAGR